MKRIVLFFCIALILALFTGCKGDNPSESKGTAVPAPDENKVTVTGSVFSTTLNAPYPKASVWLAEVFREGGDGVYVLDHAFSPAVYADDQGVFVIPNIDPKEYVIIIGDPEGYYEVIPSDDGTAKVWYTESGKVLDVGQLSVSLSP